jgi:hypothetical protein
MIASSLWFAPLKRLGQEGTLPVFSWQRFKRNWMLDHPEARVIYSVSSRIWLKYSLKDILGIPNNRRLQVWTQAFGRDQFDFPVEQSLKVKSKVHEISEVLLAFSEFNEKINIARLFLFFRCKRTK